MYPFCSHDVNSFYYRRGAAAQAGFWLTLRWESSNGFCLKSLVLDQVLQRIDAFIPLSGPSNSV
jgi:hypothetical protein